MFGKVFGFVELRGLWDWQQLRDGRTMVPTTCTPSAFELNDDALEEIVSFTTFLHHVPRRPPSHVLLFTGKRNKMPIRQS
jgi:hypothetical protein